MPETQDRLDKWLIRGLYAVAIVGNAAILWDQMKDTPDVQIRVARVKAWWERKTQECEGCRRRKAAINRMLYQAQEIVEEEAEHGA